ncbi:ABC transporter permease [Actinoplanes sp. CA-015351]|uniref:ABC transporter permease n=1 Tax=Actinoplanes sp. CA-015351 TaxID=3239897 RepID=UPI003D97816B
MTRLAVRMLRHRPGSSVATLLALALGAVILTAMGVLVESGLRHHPAPVRYAAADLVVARPDTTFTSTEFDGEIYRSTAALPEGTVPDALSTALDKLPGVAAVATDENIPVGGQAIGRSWSSAVLTPYTLTAGTAPARDDQVVLTTGRSQPGDRVELLVGGVLRAYTVSGRATGSAGAAVFFSDAQAAALSPRRGEVTAIGVIATPGTDLAALKSRIAGLTGDARVLTSDDSGLAERSADRAAAGLLVQIGASFGGYVALLIIFVVAATVGLSVRHRRRDLALVRAVAATPAQVRRMIMMETALISALAGVIGVPCGLLAARWLTGELEGRGFLPASFPMLPGVLAAPAAFLTIVTAAVLAGLLAARRIAGIKPAEALGEAAALGESGRKRLVGGLIALAAAAATTGAAAGTSGQTAMGAAIGMLYLFVLAVALLAPWINRAAARLLGGPLRAIFGTSGYLAAANLRANAQGAATVLTSLVLAVGFGGSVWFLQDNLERQAVAESRQGLLAARALVAPAGLPSSAVAEVRALPGVRAATPLRHTSVVVALMGDAETIPARAADLGTLASTVDLGVVEGALSADSAAVSRTHASMFGWELGEKVEMRLADGRAVTPRIGAIYQRGLGFGDVILPLSLVGGLPDEVLIDAPSSLAIAAYPGTSVVDTAALTGGLARDLALSAWLNRLLIAVMVGYTAVAAANTMVMAALARRRELALLRLTGVTRRQVKLMINAEQIGLLGTAVVLGGAVAALTLSSVVRALTGDPVPYVPAVGWITVLGGTTALALTTTILPIAALLRRPPAVSG